MSRWPAMQVFYDVPDRRPTVFLYKMFGTHVFQHLSVHAPEDVSREDHIEI